MTVNNFTEAARMDLINEILFWICLFVLLWNGYILLFNRGVPNITSSKQVCQAMADILKEDRAAKNKDSYVVYDLGSGNGRLTKKIAREIPDARVVGIEISGLAFWTSKLLKKIMKFENIEYRKADFFDVDLSKPDAIIFYQSIYEMGRLGEKLMNEVGPDHIVVSNRFKLTAGWENYSEEIPLEKQGPLQKNINVYRKPEAA